MNTSENQEKKGPKESTVSVTICAGTTCYVMGGADLLMLAENPPADLADRVEWSGCACLGSCREEGAGRAPFVRIGERVISRVDPESLLKELRDELR